MEQNQAYVQETLGTIMKDMKDLTPTDIATKIYLDFDVDYVVTSGMSKTALLNLYKNLHKKRK